ncbi:unnamed protein product [Caenorhabditis nigoni]
MVMDRSWIQRTKMSGVPDVVTQTSCGGWGSWDHSKKIKERRTRTVGPLDRWRINGIEERRVKIKRIEGLISTGGCSVWMDSSPTCWLHWRSRSHQHRGNNDWELCPVKRKAVVSEQRLSWDFVEELDGRQRLLVKKGRCCGVT